MPAFIVQEAAGTQGKEASIRSFLYFYFIGKILLPERMIFIGNTTGEKWQKGSQSLYFMQDFDKILDIER